MMAMSDNENVKEDLGETTEVFKKTKDTLK